MEELRIMCFSELEGVGDDSLGEWEERGEIAYHLRRRLSESESKHVGPVKDLRGTKQATRRFRRVKDILPEQAIHLAQVELA